MKKQETILTDGEFKAQRAAAQSVAKREDRPKTYHIVTYGCQMNSHDSEKIAGMLGEMGMAPADKRDEADMVVFNTCCVRENAENRALGNVMWLRTVKKNRPDMIVIVCGCMTQQPGMLDKLRRQYAFVDMMLGTHNLGRLPVLLHQFLETRTAQLEVLSVDGGIAEGLPISRANPYQAYITVMQGCDNFCSYCIVPYVRGRERSRAPHEIINEAKMLRDAGVQEITLLGQNVNSYGRGLADGMDFAQLLRELDKTGIPRIRFMTSHPKDLSDALIGAYAELESLCPHLHLPVQSGSDHVLSAMNRGYTIDKYRSLVKRLRAARPGIGLTTDIIVGFPGESQAQFEETMSLAREVRYDSAFTFVFSSRPGTAAAKLKDDVPEEEKTRRIEALIALQHEITDGALRSMVGETQSVLVEGVSARDSGHVGGKNGRAITVNAPGSDQLVGKIVNMRITGCGRSTLKGEVIGGQDDGGEAK